MKVSGGSLPIGPMTSTALMGTSADFSRTAAFDLGKSINCSVTSGGIDIAADPIRDSLGAEVEKDCGRCGSEKAGTRKEGRELNRADSRRS